MTLKTLLFSFAILLASFVNAFSLKTNTFSKQVAHNTLKQHAIKVALLLDTSNSMDGLIDQAKAQLWNVVNELSYAKCGTNKPNLEIALYEYGNDRLTSKTGYIRQVLAFSNDLDDISEALFKLTTNGGSEYCGQVIQTALQELDWGKDADDLKLIFIAGNEPFTQGKVNYKHAATNANEKDITVNTIYCGNYNNGIQDFWKDGADLTQGDYIAINQNQATVHVASPYDDAILQLNIKLNKTYVAYGKRGKEKAQLQAQQDINARGYNKANAVGRAVSKSSHLYKNSNWDLVDAVEAEEVAVETLDREALPEALKDKSSEAIKRYVLDKQNERDAIKKEIQKLNSKRKAYISKNSTKATNGLENAMTKAIKQQAEKKQYSW